MMVYLLTEENSQLKNRSFPLTKGIRQHLMKTLEQYKGSRAVDGWKRLNNLLNSGSVSYTDMKRIKSFFDNFPGDKDRTEYILNGGDAMRNWVDNTLATARSTVKNFKQAKKDAGFKNAFRRAHTKDRASVKVRESRTFIVNESQIKPIREAMDYTFSFEELSSLPSYNKRYEYCVKHCGNPIGKGSARVVFQLNEEKVLKLAYNEKGVAQNEAEYQYGNVNQQQYYFFFPHVFEIGKDGLWLVSEAVLPASKKDFKEVIGYSWEECQEFMTATWHYMNQNLYSTSLSQEQWDEMNENEDLKEISEYIRSEEPPVGDMLRISSWGLVKRNSSLYIVLLDNGLTEEISEKYYTRH